jgi:hypothetical protein
MAGNTDGSGSTGFFEVRPDCSPDLLRKAITFRVALA